MAALNTMAANICYVTLFILGIHLALGSPSEDQLRQRPKGGGIETRYCAYYNGTQKTICVPQDNGTCTTITDTTDREECLPVESERSTHCVHLWHYNSKDNTATIRFKGCFLDTVACKDRASPCRIHNITKILVLTCCCEGDMCNANVTINDLDASWLRREADRVSPLTTLV